MQFRVPQFIDTEDKIIGPLGWKQLAYIVAGLGLTYIIFRVSSSKLIATIFAIPALCLFGALAFVRINNRDFLSISEDAVKYFFSNKIYTWQKEKKANTTYVSSADVHMNNKNLNQTMAAYAESNINNNKEQDILNGNQSFIKNNHDFVIKKVGGKLSDKAFDLDMKSDK